MVLIWRHITHTHTTILHLSGLCLASRCQKKHSSADTYRGHQSSLICFLHLPRSMLSSPFNLHAWQSFSTVSKFSLVYLLAWHPPLHIPYISSPNHCLLFCNTLAYHDSLLCCSTEIMSSNPSLSLNSLLGTLSCSLMLHIHLTILISAHWSATSFSLIMSHY